MAYLPITLQPLHCCGTVKYDWGPRLSLRLHCLKTQMVVVWKPISQPYRQRIKHVTRWNQINQLWHVCADFQALNFGMIMPMVNTVASCDLGSHFAGSTLVLCTPHSTDSPPQPKLLSLCPHSHAALTPTHFRARHFSLWYPCIAGITTVPIASQTLLI